MQAMMNFIVTNLNSLIGIVGIWFLAVLMPGPDIFLVVRTAVSMGKKAGFHAVFGILAGTIVWLVVGFFIIEILIQTHFFDGMKIAGGCYLLFSAYKLFSTLRQPSQMPRTQVDKRSFYTGILTNLSNPKAPFFVSIILSKLPPTAPLEVSLGLFFVMLLIPFLWFNFVVCVLSLPACFQIFWRYNKIIDAIAGVVFVIFGCDLILEGVRGLI